MLTAGRKRRRGGRVAALVCLVHAEDVAFVDRQQAETPDRLPIERDPRFLKSFAGQSLDDLADRAAASLAPQSREVPSTSPPRLREARDSPANDTSATITELTSGS